MKIPSESHLQKAIQNEREHWYMALSYLWILWVVALLRWQWKWHYRHAGYSFHVKQGAVLFSLSFIIFFASLIPGLGAWLYAPLALAWLGLSLLGFLRAWHGEQKPLPFLGKICRTWRL
jgi:uncharacterized membrane protein